MGGVRQYIDDIRVEIPDPVWADLPKNVKRLIHSARALAMEVERRGIMPRRELSPETFYERKESK